jgi:phosphatidate cytidylyltransferase
LDRDSAAYYGGITFGKHKLFPRVSPKKAGKEQFLVLFFCRDNDFSEGFGFKCLKWINVVVIGIIIGTIGQIGDLVEPLIKRDSEVKDSSSLIPDTVVFLTGLILCSSALLQYGFI